MGHPLILYVLLILIQNSTDNIIIEGLSIIGATYAH